MYKLSFFKEPQRNAVEPLQNVDNSAAEDKVNVNTLPTFKIGK